MSHGLGKNVITVKRVCCSLFILEYKDCGRISAALADTGIVDVRNLVLVYILEINFGDSMINNSAKRSF